MKHGSNNNVTRIRNNKKIKLIIYTNNKLIVFNFIFLLFHDYYNAIITPLLHCYYSIYLGFCKLTYTLNGKMKESKKGRNIVIITIDLQVYKNQC